MATKKTNTNTTTRTVEHAATGNPLAAYSAVLKTWPAKYAGPKPTAEIFKAVHGLGAKPGSKTAMALAMYLRNAGATQAQVVVINNGPYLNKMRQLVDAGAVKREALPKNDEGHTVYKLTLTAKATAKRKPASKRKATAKPASKATAKPAKPADNAATAS